MGAKRRSRIYLDEITELLLKGTVDGCEGVWRILRRCLLHSAQWSADKKSNFLNFLHQQAPNAGRNSSKSGLGRLFFVNFKKKSAT